MGIKKVVGLMVVIVAVVSLAACSSSNGGSDPAQDAVTKSSNGFGDILDSIFDNPGSCTEKTMLECTCPGGGTIDFDESSYELTFNGCKTNDGLTYNGTIQTDEDVSSITADMSQFGECSNVTGTIVGAGDDNCSGSLSGTCAGESITCNITSDCDDCTI